MKLVYTLPVFDDAKGTETGTPYAVWIESRAIPLADSFEQSELRQGVVVDNSDPIFKHYAPVPIALASLLTRTEGGHLYRLYPCLADPVSEVVKKQGGWVSRRDLVWVWERES